MLAGQCAADCGCDPWQAQHQSLFEPQLPAWKTRAIEGLGFGLCEKIFVRLQPDAAAEQSQYSPHNQLCVAYHLLWDVPFPDCPPQEGVQQNGHPDPGSAPQGSLASQPEPVPWWASGLFSFRFGGSEFKPAYADPAQRATQPKSITFPEQKYTGSSNLIYGNSSGEVAYMASTHSPTGLPALQESQQGGCLWLAGAGFILNTSILLARICLPLNRFHSDSCLPCFVASSSLHQSRPCE